MYWRTPMAIIMDGKALAAKMQDQLHEKVARLKEKEWIVPGLVVIMVGDNPASQVYVRNKERAAKKAGFHSQTVNLSESISEEELIEVIERYNQDPLFHGILVQLPLPNHINEMRILLAIDPKKDVDGFHPMNTGNLWNGRRQMVPCTPAGIMEILREYNVELEGKTAVIIGRSNIVGKPMASLMMQKAYPGDATVTVCHSRSKDLVKECQEADIIIAALGQPNFVKAEMVKEGAVIIDVGTTRVPDATKKSGFKLTGDVKFDEVAPKCSYITPVPGGVGPMTIVSLMKNTLLAGKKVIYK